MRSSVLSLALLSFTLSDVLHSRPVDLSIPPGGHGPIDSNGFAQHWIELPGVNFGGGLALPLRLTLQSLLTGSHGFGHGLWMSPMLDSKILNGSASQWQVLLPCGKVLTLQPDAAQPGRFATQDGEWVGRKKGSLTLVSREDGWLMEFNQRGHLIRLRTDSGRTVLWNRLANGSLRTLIEAAPNNSVTTGLTVNWDPATNQVASMDVRTSAGLKTLKFDYLQSEQLLTEISFPDRSTERFSYSFDDAGNPGISIRSRSLTETNLTWRKNSLTLISDGLWTYEFKKQGGGLYPLTIRTGPGGEKEIYHDDFKNGRTIFTSADGTKTTRQNVVAPGPAKGKLQSITRQVAGAPNAVTLYQASYDLETGMIFEEVNALGHKTRHQHELHGNTPHSGIKLQTVTNALGGKTTSEFDVQGNLIAETNALGHTTRFEYNAQNHRVKTIGPDGTVVEALTYNSQGRIVTRTDAIGAVTKYGYDERGNQTSIIDALGHTTRHEYDERGNRTATIDALGHATRHEYDAGKHLIATVLPEVGNAAPSGKGVRLQPAFRHVYDGKGNRLRTLDASGNVWESATYDLFGRITSRTNALGHVTRYEYEAKKGACGSGACGPSDQPTRITSPGGSVIERVYDADRNIIEETMAAGTPEASVIKHVHDIAGNRIQTTDPLGHVTTFEFDALNQRVSILHPDKSRELFAYDAAGNMISATNELGHTTKREYDVYNNLVSVTNPEGHVSRILFADSDSGRLEASSGAYAALHRPIATVSAAGIRTNMEHDVLGRRISLTRAPGTSEAATTRFVYDAVGNETQSVTPSGRVTKHTYDSRNRRVQTVGADQRSWTYVYNDGAVGDEPAPCCGLDAVGKSRVAMIVHPDGGRESSIYNVAGQLIASTDAKGSTVKYQYDMDGKLSEFTDANGSTTRWRHDARGKLVAKVYADETSELFEWDALGRMKRRIRPDGTIAAYTYSNRGLVTNVQWNDTKTESSTFEYDQAGRMTLAANKTATIKRKYTPAGHLEAETQTINSPVTGQNKTSHPLLAAEVGYEYDADGRLIKIAYPDGSRLSYRYNLRGELSEMADSTLEAVSTAGGLSTYSRRPDGKTARLSLPNGVVTLRNYDAVGRLSEIKHLTPAGDVLYSEASLYDKRSRRTARVQADGSADLFAYDPAGQITAAAYGQTHGTTPPVSVAAPLKPEAGSPALNFRPSQTFVYDPAGNRLESTDGGATTKYQPNAANQYAQIEAAVSGQLSVVKPAFDKLGNLVSDDRNIYTWDANIHLLSVSTKPLAEGSSQARPSSTTSFGYDPLHRRVWRHEEQEDAFTLFVHDGWNVIAEYSVSRGSGSKEASLAARHAWGEDVSGSLKGAGGSGGLMTTSIFSPANSAPVAHYFFNYDGNGNVALVSNSKGKEEVRYRYDAFGKTLFSSKKDFEHSRYQAGTKVAESKSGLAYYGYRYYSPTLGRWISRDPIGEHGGVNLYQMVGNNVVNRIDYLGLAECEFAYAVGHAYIVQELLDIFNEGDMPENGGLGVNGCEMDGIDQNPGNTISGFAQNGADNIGSALVGRLINNGGFNPEPDSLLTPGNERLLNQTTGFFKLIMHNWAATASAANAAAQNCCPDCSEISAGFICLDPFNQENFDFWVVQLDGETSSAAQNGTLQGLQNANGPVPVMPRCGQVVRFKCAN